MASTRSTSASGTPSRWAMSSRVAEEIAGLVDLLDDLLGDDRGRRPTGSRRPGARRWSWSETLLAGEAVEIGAFARPPPPMPVQAEAAVEAAHRIGGAVLVEILAVLIDVERAPRRRPRRSRAARRPSASPSLGRRARARLAGSASPPPVSSSGFFSSSSAMKLSISRLESASSWIACWSCGVITSDWDWRRSRRGPRAIDRLPRHRPRKRAVQTASALRTSRLDCSAFAGNDGRWGTARHLYSSKLSPR